MKKAFTLLEITVVLFIVSAITIGFIQNFVKAQRSHKTNTLLQEMMILRNGFLAYYESKGSFPEIALASLSDDSFADIKPYWYPFNPEASKVVEHKTSWSGSTSTTVANTYLRLVSSENLNLIQAEILATAHNLCKIVLADDGKTCDFYLFKAFDAE